jgi:CTP synthase
MTKYIIVCGGVISGIGKGVIGTNPTPDMYCLINFCLSLFNWSAVENDRIEGHRHQNRSLHEHRCRDHAPNRTWWILTYLKFIALKFMIGEVYVLNDGGEVDLDLGNYERYLDVTLSRDNNITTGKIYREVIEKEVCIIAISNTLALNAIV